MPSTPLPQEALLFFGLRLDASGSYVAMLLAAPQGGGPQSPLLTSGPWLRFSVNAYPTWSPKGTHILFKGTDPGGAHADDLYVMPAAGGAPKKITAHAPITGIYRAGAWSPDRRAVVFSAYTPKAGNQLFTVPPEGGAATQLTSDNGETKCFPVYSPDGTRIAFTKWNGDLHVMPAGGGAPVMLHDGVPRGRVSWSPDSTRLTYARRDPQTRGWAVWVADVESAARTNLTGADYDPTGVCTPTFSPDGSLIAFFASYPHLGPLAVVPTAGGVTRFLAPLVNGQRSHCGIAWSNDSTRVAYVTGGGPGVSPMGLSSTDIAGVTTPLASPTYADLHSPNFRALDPQKPALKIAA